MATTMSDADVPDRKNRNRQNDQNNRREPRPSKNQAKEHEYGNAA